MSKPDSPDGAHWDSTKFQAGRLGQPVGAGDGGTFVSSPVYKHDLIRVERLLVEAVEAMRDLTGAIIDNSSMTDTTLPVLVGMALMLSCSATAQTLEGGERQQLFVGNIDPTMYTVPAFCEEEYARGSDKRLLSSDDYIRICEKIILDASRKVTDHQRHQP